MKLLQTILLFALLGFSLASCSKKDDLSGADNIPGLGGDTWAKSAIDQWILDTLTSTYNIGVKYKWDQFEFELDKTLVPPMESKVQPVLSGIKQVWIDNYVIEAGMVFFKKYCPKTFVLSGGASWNSNGTITLGTAEGGHKVVIYNLNEYRTKGMPGFVLGDSSVPIQMYHVIEHEFGHILHQTVLYPQEFKQITAGKYTSNWNNVSDMEAWQEGFVTPYAMSAFDEDFVEMISTMLTLGKAGFDNIVNSIPPGTSVNGTTQEQAVSALRQKEAIVVNYYKKVWNVDFYSLQTRTRQSIEKQIY
ncbi:zinc-binding metallopeptidase [Deminuibacter soli]|uniref:Substrate import-associated zinc metallohydrolase lipoprotein n=1 Tax=Deminuibacter soli TaxID=2291815 RepID=A0A3E1NE84_9BACT|nr:putative zinc-binding metallopeptidase [Deminuibacter soli]RFM26285.1 hypothetical protein DXN05_20465 [Deminuibacter soli]